LLFRALVESAGHGSTPLWLSATDQVSSCCKVLEGMDRREKLAESCLRPIVLRLKENRMPLIRKLISDTKRCIRVAAFSLAMLATLPVWAGPIIQLPIRRGGRVTYQPGSHHHVLSGIGIPVDQLILVGGKMPTIILPILMGHLAFTTGIFSSSSVTTMFGPGGSFVIKGCADLHLDPKCEKGDLRGTLFTGTFLDAQLINKNGKEILEAQLLLQLAPQLAAFFHLPDTKSIAEMELILVKFGGHGHGLQYRVQGGSVQDFPVVPEPASIAIFGGSVLALGAVRLVSGLRSKLYQRGRVPPGTRNDA